MNKNKVIYKAIFVFIQKGLMGGFTWRGVNTNVTKKTYQTHTFQKLF